MSLAAAGLIGVAAYHVTAVHWIDGNSLSGFASLSGSPTIHSFSRVIENTANTIPFALFTLILLSIAFARRGARRAASVALLLAGANVSCAVLKPNLFPPRDTENWTNVPHLPVPSFPSGHATA